MQANSLTVSSMSFLLSRLTHINEAQNTYRLHHYELQEEEEEGFHALPPFIFSPLLEIFERSVTYLGANWANKHVSHTVHLHHPNQASSEYLVHALCNALWEERDCALCQCFICLLRYIAHAVLWGRMMNSHGFSHC